MHYLASNLASNLVDYSITQQLPDGSLKDKLVTVIGESVSFTKYEHELIEASVVDYRKMMKDQDVLIDLLTSEKQIHLRTFDTERKAWCDLKFDIGNNTARSGHGLHTLCDGMVYTSPYPESVEGDVFFNEYVNTGSGDIKRDKGATIIIGRHEVSWKGDRWVVS